MKISPVARQRRHTLHFLAELDSQVPVYLDTEVDMSRVLRHRDGGRRYSVVTYVLRAAGEALTVHPEANVALHGRRVARFDAVHGKVTFDKTVDGERVVVSGLVRDLHTAALEDVQRGVERYRDGSPESMPEFAPMRLLHRMPRPLGRLMFRLGVRPLSRRADVMGTVAVTSLGHRPVDSFHSLGGTTVTLGVGRITDRPVVRDGAVTIAPVMRLSMAFDHRAIDGALAADVLAEVKDVLENHPVDQQAGHAGHNGHLTRNEAAR